MDFLNMKQLKKKGVTEVTCYRGIISTLDGTAGQDAGGGASTNVLFQAALGVIKLLVGLHDI
jgi:hypothetical protein